MEFTINYLTDLSGNIEAVQIPFNEWKVMLEKLNSLVDDSELINALKRLSVQEKSYGYSETEIVDYVKEIRAERYENNKT
ncbi:MAG: hypothetical protein DRJ10_01080 [Bacteroidetes bacterium]|nr:MAG: hypothetical protein DRJ10_01080 [Bacteroidota bacterium]